jgi:hypothetical protein
MAPSAIPRHCASREQLKEALLEANREVIKWDEEELRAMADGDQDRLEKAKWQLQNAKLKRYSAIEAVRVHAGEHNCG